jgi:hypothetical protein
MFFPYKNCQTLAGIQGRASCETYKSKATGRKKAKSRGVDGSSTGEDRRVGRSGWVDGGGRNVSWFGNTRGLSLAHGDSDGHSPGIDC